MKVVHNDADAEDLLQEVFVEIWNRVGAYDPRKGRPLSWIATLARRRSIDRLRRRASYQRFEDRFTEEAKIHDDHWTHVLEDLGLAELKEHVRRALATLPEAQRSTIKLAYHGQMTQREIAAHTGTPLGTVKTRLELGLKKMAARLGRFDDLLALGRGAVKTLGRHGESAASPNALPMPMG
jgi:RNA polymerase sigma-70 factor (ECF subfamily)